MFTSQEIASRRWKVNTNRTFCVCTLLKRPQRVAVGEVAPPTTGWGRLSKVHTQIEHFGRAPCGAPVVLGHGARGGFPHRTKAHKCCRVNLSAYPAAAPTTFPARGPPCSRSSPTCFRERHNVKEKSDGFPAVQTAQLFASPTRPGKTCPPRNYPGGNHILPLSPFQVRICPV